ncbi:MAG: hypothetical protein K0R41_929 [Geminicoccaceae bacterium]|jgi:hypothetical protein|nr:hypothetical protein [Geminicoccaceae bacterium]MCE3247104.1 hypothetical protein [Geminicoccaceae bacterium]
MPLNLRRAALLIVLAPAALGACAGPATIGGMTASDTGGTAIPPALEHSMTVGVVTGGEPTNPLWKSEVGNEEFRSALANSLRNFGLIAEGEQSKYAVDAALIDLQQPSIGFSLTVTSTVEYRVRPSGSAQVVFEDTVIAPYTASATSSFLGTERLRLANEGSIKENLETFIERLSARMNTMPVS